MPHKANTACRHHIPRAKRRVTNWAEYDAALRQRGSSDSLIQRGGDSRLESFAPNHARGPAFILEHGDPDGIDLAHSVWPSAAPDRRVDRFDHSSAGDRACSSRSFHARPARSNSDLAKVDAPSCWAPAIDCRQHGTEAEWSRRMAGRKVWNNKAPLMAQIAYRLGRSLWRDCR